MSKEKETNVDHAAVFVNITARLVSKLRSSNPLKMVGMALCNTDACGARGQPGLR